MSRSSLCPLDICCASLMGTVGFALQEPSKILSRVQKYSETLVKSDLNTANNTSNGIVGNVLQLLVCTYTSEEETVDYQLKFPLQFALHHLSLGWRWGGEGVGKGAVRRKVEGCGEQEVFVAWWSSSAAQARAKTSPSFIATGRAFLSRETGNTGAKKSWSRDTKVLIQGTRCRSTVWWPCIASSVHTLSQAGGCFWEKDIINSAFQKLPAVLRASELVFQRNFLLENVRGFFFLHDAAGSCMLCCHTWHKDEG